MQEIKSIWYDDSYRGDDVRKKTDETNPKQEKANCLVAPGGPAKTRSDKYELAKAKKGMDKYGS